MAGGALIFTVRTRAVAGSNPAVHVRLFCWLLVLWGARRSARKKANCARPYWRKLRVLGLAAGRLFPRPDRPVREAAGGVLGLKA